MMERSQETPKDASSAPPANVPESTSLSDLVQPSATCEVSELEHPSDPPIYKTFVTTELCEEILGHLPILDLWRARSA